MSDAHPAPSLQFVAETALPTDRGTWRVRAYRDARTGTEPLAIVYGDVQGRPGLPVRVHDACLTSEVLGSLKCDCRDQLDYAMDHIRAHGAGVVIYLHQEGRGIGLANKIAAYALQEQGLDTVDANRALGLPDDARRYEAAAEMLTELGLTRIGLITNNPRKAEHLQAHGITIGRRIPVIVPRSAQANRYLQVKQDRLHHLALAAGSLASK